MLSSWFSSPATKKRAPEHGFSSRTIVLVLLVCGVAVVFWQQLIGAAVFIGETDRLNTYLNMRLSATASRFSAYTVSPKSITCI
jgi:hypothetical protein